MPSLLDLFEIFCTSAPRFVPAPSSILPSQERLLRFFPLSERTASRFPAWTVRNRPPPPSPSARSFRPRLSARAGNTIFAHSVRSVARWVFPFTTSFFSFPFSTAFFSSVLTVINFFPSYQDLLPFTVPPQTNTLFPLNIFTSWKHWLPLNSTQLTKISIPTMPPKWFFWGQ